MKAKARAQGHAEAFHEHRPEVTPSEGDYLEVAGFAEARLPAVAVTLTLQVEADVLVASPDAIDRVPALAAIAKALQEVGARALGVTQYEGHGRSGLLGSSVEARYGLRAEVDVAALAGALEVTAKSKAATLTRACWRFDGDALVRDADRAAATQAREEAEGLAAALGATLGKAHRVLVERSATDPAAPVARVSKSASVEDLHVRLAAERRVLVKVLVRYRLG